MTSYEGVILPPVKSKFLSGFFLEPDQRFLIAEEKEDP